MFGRRGMKNNKFLTWLIANPEQARGIELVPYIFGLVSRITMLLLPIISLVMIYEVVKRYMFSDPTVWVNELSVWMAAAVYLVSGLYVTRDRAHIRISTFVDMAPRKYQLALEAFSLVILSIYVWAIVIGGWNAAASALLNWERQGTAFNPPIPATIKPLIVIVAVGILIQSLVNFVKDLRKYKYKSER